ncbi:hypothetical protein DPMN_179482 [Dreissena polymorpha]|uniref:Uncharacterized protein n=1 Tax=Dreissena polymorpha TaxID=45954 RepID=A0A9D4ECF6_DREPO|nr:hypothetical protein DPMN_179482 [Dreissena polymorpha]
MGEHHGNFQGGLGKVGAHNGGSDSCEELPLLCKADVSEIVTIHSRITDKMSEEPCCPEFIEGLQTRCLKSHAAQEARWLGLLHH